MFSAVVTSSANILFSYKEIATRLYLHKSEESVANVLTTEASEIKMISKNPWAVKAPCPSEYVPDPMELKDHVLVYIPEPEHPEDLVPAEDEAPIEP
ncbi:hypothetical protein Tco_1532816 [Tanacetum coccineum]